MVVVDPVIGDSGKGLFVPAEVAQAVIDHLIPRADLVAPNSWELQRITGADARSPEAAAKAARLLGKAVLVSSVVRRRDRRGLCRSPGGLAGRAPEDRRDRAQRHGRPADRPVRRRPALLEGQTPSYGLARAVGGLAETIASAGIWASPELPIVAMGARIKQASPTVRIERLAC